ncbi:hypothetical protein JVU11DRAFT_11595 [Chiua virens]|nr:hypothetical protein JVU11DRAFT_11595 [Chiua virens]
MPADGSFWVVTTHYHFLHEVPRFAGYEMKMSIGAWDHKWLYLVCRFASRSPKSCGKSSSSTKLEDPSILTEFPMQNVTSELKSDFSSSEDNASSTLLESRVRQEPNRTILHCFTVSRLCFKIGRITVPPAIVMACEGFSKPPEFGSYSHQSPPPHWVHPHTLRNTSDSLEAYRGFLAGGWRDVPQGDRWWVEPLSGPIEERRRANLKKLEIIDQGVVGCMSDI